MSKIIRATQSVFSSGQPGDIFQFGSKAAGSPSATTNVETIQALPAWLNGWRAALLANNQAGIQDQDAINYVITSQLAYIFQEGIPEYDSGTIYFTNSIVKNPGTTQLYKSIVDDNTGNALSNASFWVLLGDLAVLSTCYSISNPQPIPNIFPDFTAGITVNDNTVEQAVTHGWFLCGAETYHLFVGTTNNPTQSVSSEGGGVYNVFYMTPIPANYYYKFTSSPTVTGTFFPIIG